MLTRSQKTVIAFGGLLYLISVMLILFQSYATDVYFIFSIIGFLVIVQLTGPAMTRPKWRARTDHVIMVGFLLFLALVVLKLINIISA
jgi:hypothetical protein